MEFPEQAFRQRLTAFWHEVQDEQGLWTIRGFVHIARKVYGLTSDTKVISKALELVLMPELISIVRGCGFDPVIASEQNEYPDISLVRNATRYALDIKSAYRTGRDLTRVSGFTLGAFTGYFRNRESTKNVTFPYGTYADHWVLGIIYTRSDVGGRLQSWPLAKLEDVPAPIRDIEFTLQPKWKIALDRPGSGNTCNIGAVQDIDRLREGRGPFAMLGEEGQEIFEDYWSHYLTNDMARRVELTSPPYRNLAEYLRYRNRQDLLQRLEEETSGEAAQTEHNA